MGWMIYMKKILSILLIFALITSGFVSTVSARCDEDDTVPQNWTMNSWGQKQVRSDGDVTLFNQTVVVSNTSMHISVISPDFVILDDCSVTIHTNATITVTDSEGKFILSPNGLPFRFSTGSQKVMSPHYTNEPADGAVVEDTTHNDFLVILADDIGSSMAPYYETEKKLMSTTRGIVFGDDDGNRYRGVLSDRFVADGFVHWTITFTSKTCSTIYEFAGTTATDGVNLSVGTAALIQTTTGTYHNVHAVPEGQSNVVVTYTDGTRICGSICQ